MITHRLNLKDYDVGEEFKTFGGDRVVSNIGTDDNGEVTSLEVAQLFPGNSFIYVGMYTLIKMFKGEQRFHDTRTIIPGDSDYRKYLQLSHRMFLDLLSF